MCFDDPLQVHLVEDPHETGIALVLFEKLKLVRNANSNSCIGLSEGSEDPLQVHVHRSIVLHTYSVFSFLQSNQGQQIQKYGSFKSK